MRPDMKKVLTERPRSGHLMDYKHFRRSKRGKNSAIARSMSKPYGYDRNSTSDVLGPIIKYLKSQVGRPWNDVWSDVCKNNDARSVSGSHLRDHVRWLVYTNVFIDEQGQVWDNNRRFPLNIYSRNTFYVDDNGLLCFIPRTPHSKYKAPESKVVRMYGMEYFQYDGVWYEVKTAPLVKRKYTSGLLDRSFTSWPNDVFGFHAESHSWNDKFTCFNMYGENIYSMSKKQVGKRIIKKINKYLEENNKYSSKSQKH